MHAQRSLRARRTSLTVVLVALFAAGCGKKEPTPEKSDSEVAAERGKAAPAPAERRAPAAQHAAAIQAVKWGQPIVSMDAMRQAFFRDAGAKYNDIVFWSKPSDWKNQTTTPNAATNYAYFNFNTKEGPVVLEMPAALGAGMYGSVLNAWQTPLADLGPNGEDGGKGGKFLLVPPGYTGQVPAGYRVVHFDTHNGYGLLRAIPENGTPRARERAIGLIKALRLYPLSAAERPAQRFVDMSGKLFDGMVRYDETFFTSLARMVDEEPALPRDKEALAQLASLGIEKGKPFQPTQALELRNAVSEAHRSFMEKTPLEGEPYWADRKWRTPSVVGARTGFSYETNGKVDVDGRALAFFLAYAPPKQLGTATMYVMGYTDGTGQPLSGENTYRLYVPPNVPAKQFWAVTVYDLSSAGFIREAQRVELNSYDEGMKKNGDGSVDVYFGPMAPAGKASNWVSTEKGKPWFAMFRFYGPGPALADKTFKLADLVKVP